MNYLHIFPMNAHKSLVVFDKTIISFFDSNLNRDGFPRHRFLVQVLGECDENISKLDILLNAKSIKHSDFNSTFKSILNLLNDLNNQVLVFHQLPSVKTRLYIGLLSCFMKIEYDWIVWGGDLYDTNCLTSIEGSIKKRQKLKVILMKFINKLFVRNLRRVYSVDDDEIVFKNQYPKVKAEFMRFYYPNPAIGEYQVKSGSAVNVLISHSASIQNNHIAAMKAINKYSNTRVNVYAILSYGGEPEYIRSVIKSGQELFSDHFFPIVDFMSTSEYSEFLKSIDVALFLTNRQSSIFTSVTMMSQGTKIVMKGSVSPFGFYKKLGLNVYDFSEEVKSESLLELNSEQLQNNSKLINKLWGSEELTSIYKRIFY